MKPSVGRIVEYRAETQDGVAHQAALIVHVFSDTSVRLVTWNAHGTANTVEASFDSDGAVGTWRWPARV